MGYLGLGYLSLEKVSRTLNRFESGQVHQFIVLVLNDIPRKRL